MGTNDSLTLRPVRILFTSEVDQCQSMETRSRRLLPGYQGGPYYSVLVSYLIGYLESGKYSRLPFLVEHILFVEEKARGQGRKHPQRIKLTNCDHIKSDFLNDSNTGFSI